MGVCFEFRTRRRTASSVCRATAHRIKPPLSDSIGADFDQDEKHELVEGYRIGGHESVNATPAKPSKRTVPPIIVATIPTYFRSLFSDITAGTLS